MSCDPADQLKAANVALSQGAWADARTAFEAVLARQTSAEALAGLGTALWWLGETESAVRYQERAYAEFRRHHDPMQAALLAVGLCLLYRASLGNYAASRGWLGRLARLVDDYGLTPIRGWLALCRAVTANDRNEPSVATPCAQEAADVGRRTDDADLELCALAELGTALTQLGQTDDGAALLDEAMAGALGGEPVRPETVVFVGCRTIVCCSRTGDIERGMQWIRAGTDFSRRYGGLHLDTVCRVHHGSILFAAGRWIDAERELLAALKVGQGAEPSLHAEALAGLADLRVAQGRIVEAVGLLAGLEDHVAAACVRAAAHLKRAEPSVAAEILRGRLAGFDEPCLESTRVVELLVEAELALGETDRAVGRARELAAMGGAADCELITARAQRALGRALAAGGDADAATEYLHRALAGFTRLGMPLEAARTGLALATTLAQHEPQAAIGRARTALAAFEQLGASADADTAAALLRSLGVKAARGGPTAAGVLTRREREVLDLLAEGLSNRELADRLVLSRKTVEHHVASVLAKLGLSSRAEATAYAVRHPVHRSATT